MRFFKSKLSWALVLLGIMGFAASGGDVLATPPSGLNNVLLARGTDQSQGTLPIEEGTDIVMSQITVIPVGSSGWHSHPGGAIIVVHQGNLTVYKSVAFPIRAPAPVCDGMTCGGVLRWTPPHPLP